MLVTGADGYAVALSIGELDPGFENKQAIIAFAHDGKPENGLRLIVPATTRRGGASMTSFGSSWNSRRD